MFPYSQEAVPVRPTFISRTHPHVLRCFSATKKVKKNVKNCYLHEVVESSKQALLASRDVMISSQNFGSKWQRDFYIRWWMLAAHFRHPKLWYPPLHVNFEKLAAEIVIGPPFEGEGAWPSNGMRYSANVVQQGLGDRCLVIGGQISFEQWYHSPEMFSSQDKIFWTYLCKCNFLSFIIIIVYASASWGFAECNYYASCYASAFFVRMVCCSHSLPICSLWYAQLFGHNKGLLALKIL